MALLPTAVVVVVAESPGQIVCKMNRGFEHTPVVHRGLVVALPDTVRSECSDHKRTMHNCDCQLPGIRDSVKLRSVPIRAFELISFMIRA